jgi:hypothetical protein
MEDSFMKAAMRGHVPLVALQELADKACRRWNVPLIRVRLGRDRFWYGEYHPGEDKIDLHDNKRRRRPGHGRNFPVLLHEVAHHIDYYRNGEHHLDDAHGPTFAGICRDLYDHYEVIPKAAFDLLAKRANVHVIKVRR